MTETSNEAATSPGDLLGELSDRPLAETVLLALVIFLAVALTSYTIFYAWERPFTQIIHGMVFLHLGLSLYYLHLAYERVVKGTSVIDGPIVSRFDESVQRLVARVDTVVCLATVVVSASVGYYFVTGYSRLTGDAVLLGYSTIDLTLGLVVVVIALDATRRAYGWSIALVGIASVFYALFGSVFPGFLQHTGLSTTDVALYGATQVERSGVYGFITQAGAKYVAIFIMFAGLARAYGILDIVLDLSQQLGKRLRSGIVHVAVLSSMAMGSITGSAAANAATTGSFTIPMMQRQGIREDFSAAIEAVASSGGQIMPPVMGVAAFLMADFVGVPYVRIIQAALLPALLFYFSVGVAVQFTVLRHGWTSDRGEDTGIYEILFSKSALVIVAYFALAGGAFYAVRQIGELSLVLSGSATIGVLLLGRFAHGVVTTSTESGVTELLDSIEQFFQARYFLIPLAVLVYALAVMQLSALATGFYTVVTLIAVMYVRDLTLLIIGDESEDSWVAGADDGVSSPPGLRSTIPKQLFVTTVKTLRGFMKGALDMAPLVGVLAAMGVIIKMLTQTGLSGKISLRMVALAGGVLLVALILAMLTSILFGLGMPTPAAYVLVAALLTSPLQELGVAEITAHLFVFYFAMLSAITPPVAVGVAVASRIADSSFLVSAKQALRIGIAGFLIPFALVANDSLVTWTVTGTPVAAFSVFIGVVALTAVTIGFDGRHVLGIPHRFAYLALTLVALYGPVLSKYIGPSTATTLQVGAATIALVGLTLAQLDRLPDVVTPTAELRDR
ncbi:TRAP transporter, 4TM/12TM fusion protein [Halogranum rubrum]|uniref:TRAP transporter, 4TM/12TM fusion protein n=1 Tax=Halogranum rubrum TaxID=553466 RepID=A0A1I4HU02_9EURY|nr:TRAP transporter fused permease subunit [Halogranum rubrum]SFL45237.1 TRAP transporter, 4TM/12TM fusion protein [Halogranum rubrum]